MSAKRPSASPASGEKKRRKAITLEMKLKIIAQHEGGKPVMVISRELGLSQSTISTILKDKKRISDAVKSSASIKSTVITKKRAGPIDDMEKLLVEWIEEQVQNRIPLSLLMIQAKARSLFNMLKEHADPTYTQMFTASHGWFQRFKKRHNFHTVKVTGEAVCADIECAEAFKEELHRIIVEQKYLPEQIFNVDETSLFWKRMPECTYTDQESKAIPGLRDHVTLLLGGNVAGFKLKPFLIYHSENPRAFKNVSKHTLPVHYRHNKKAWMTSALFEDWFLNCFIPQAKEYCRQNNIAFKILLILDDAPGHPRHIGTMHPDVKVVYLPLNITTLIQPMDQGAIAAFKAQYLRQTFAQAVEATESGQTLLEFWKGFNILNAIQNIAAAWEEVTEQCMNFVWKKVLKTCGNTFNGFNKDCAVDEIVTNKILMLGKQLELDINEEDIHEIVSIKTEEISGEELIELQEERSKNVEPEEEVIPNPLKQFTTKKLAEAFATIGKGMRMLEAMDGNYERFARADRQVQDALVCYREIYNEKKKQTVCSQFDSIMKNTKPAKSSTKVNAPMPSTNYSQASPEGREIDNPGTIAFTSSNNTF
ncbi:COX assembly mitochondrial protein 2 homolog isoform X1 [Octodon degus]|uniref:COX assembly mitochondrial protein 2 homolog isoform X1 n=1 Tax=Octodon degus TaxID=10160 RepID=A0A6P6DZ84_OCTDE|nr:COX assembly mitochondrial protein 2 homolog isoform X1 [Octodon degus]XP_023565088.1 COX assembly mitochondrial protein 2 homolog isoform X1 [Octodon degus]